MAKKTTGNQIALARVKLQLEKVKRLAPRVEVLPQALTIAPRELTEVANLGDLGLQPLVLSDAAELVLSEPIDPARVLIKPTGAVYYPHIEYTRWFNRAFGRAQWNLVPVALPKMSLVPGEEKKPEGTRRFLVTQAFVLFVHGKKVAQATGAQEYHESNGDQGHDDVLEALNASALRRVAKRLGVGLELWDRAWGDAWTEAHACRVWVESSKKPVWRRRDDKPFWNESGPATDKPKPQQGQGGGSRRASGPAPVEGPWRDGPHATEKITPPQVERLWAIARKAGRLKDELKDWFDVRYGIASVKDVKRGDYDFIVRCIEAAGPLPTAVPAARSVRDPWTSDDDEFAGSRDPGEEG